MPTGEEGEMIVRGPQVMKGYLKNLEATQSTIKDGWLYTGSEYIVSHYSNCGAN